MFICRLLSQVTPVVLVVFETLGRFISVAVPISSDLNIIIEYIRYVLGWVLKDFICRSGDVNFLPK